ncbi:MAG: 2-C-methyl-D-erythritol 2,4-cyclodiphosphate synthase [Bacillota bacterium]|nr:2-C-methyl-D-erythritol 2,4-cyclodiphosphate synthase [Bacillota bacterium]
MEPIIVDKDSKPVDWLYCGAIGQDSHRFVTEEELAGQPDRPLVLAGVQLPGERPLSGNSDADVVLHALTNAMSGLTTRNILGKRADALCLSQGLTDSAIYLAEAMKDMQDMGWELIHLSIAIEAASPRLSQWFDLMRANLSRLTGLSPGHIGLTATTGEGLTSFGQGAGIQVFCQVSARCPNQTHPVGWPASC